MTYSLGQLKLFCCYIKNVFYQGCKINVTQRIRGEINKFCHNGLPQVYEAKIIFLSYLILAFDMLAHPCVKLNKCIGRPLFAYVFWTVK